MTVPFRGDPNWPQCSDLGPYQTWQLRLLLRVRVGSGCQVGTGLVRPIGDRYTDFMVEPSIRCPQCGTTNPPEAQFCMRCGTALVQRCPTCGRVNPSGAQFCLQCGTPLQGTGAAERRVVTVLFADLAGSTRLTKHLDPEPMRTLIARFFAAMREEITRYGGTVEKFIGDAVMAVFGMPAAHEDDPERALRAALAMQRRMASLNAELDADLHLRIAITTGEVVADLLAAAAGQFMVTGEVVNFAARLQAQAPPDGLVEECRQSLKHGDAPPHILRGRCPAYGEGLTYWPLAEMLKQECDIKDSDPLAVAGQKLHDGVLRVCAPVLGSDESEMLADDLATIVGTEIPRDYDTLWKTRLARLKTLVDGRPVAVRDPSVGSETRHSSEVVLHSLRGFLYARARSGPLVLVFEDLHWAEQSLLELLERLTARGGEAPMLILCLARPDLLERHATWGVRLREYTALTLSPLSPAHSARLITEALRGTVLPTDVRDAVLSRAEGNPFFLSEIMSRLIDEGSLRHEGGKWKWVSRSLDIRIPDTIQGLLLSRLDLLSPLEKRVIQDASVVGRIFWPGAINAVDSLSPDETAAAIARLVERDLIEARPASSLAGEREFAFSHALIREVAYTTLPKTARSEHHRRLATWLQESEPDHGEEVLEILAHHLQHAWRDPVE